jgi:hypothetical protein
MRGRNIFTENELTLIRGLIEEKVIAPRNEQKRIRNRIRQLGFYYTDFSNRRILGGYTVYDFNEMIEKGLIIIKNN